MNTIIIALITSISTLTASFIPLLISSRKEYKLKKYEIETVNKQSAILSFIEAVANCSYGDAGITSSSFNKYREASTKLLFYFPDVDIKLLDKLDISIHSHTHVKINDMRPIITELSKSLDNMQ